MTNKKDKSITFIRERERERERKKERERERKGEKVVHANNRTAKMPKRTFHISLSSPSLDQGMIMFFVGKTREYDTLDTEMKGERFFDAA